MPSCLHLTNRTGNHSVCAMERFAIPCLIYQFTHRIDADQTRDIGVQRTIGVYYERIWETDHSENACCDIPVFVQ